MKVMKRLGSFSYFDMKIDKCYSDLTDILMYVPYMNIPCLAKYDRISYEL